MPFSLTIEVELSELFGVMAALEKGLDVKPMVQEAATIILNGTRQRFLKEQDPDGRSWTPSQAAIDRRSEQGTGTLFKTGTLWRSIQQPDGVVTQGDLFGQAAETRITAGAFNEAGEEYGHFHQLGLGQVQRRFMGINRGDQMTFEARLVQKASEAIAAGIAAGKSAKEG